MRVFAPLLLLAFLGGACTPRDAAPSSARFPSADRVYVTTWDEVERREIAGQGTVERRRGETRALWSGDAESAQVRLMSATFEGTAYEAELVEAAKALDIRVTGAKVSVDGRTGEPSDFEAVRLVAPAWSYEAASSFVDALIGIPGSRWKEDYESEGEGKARTTFSIEVDGRVLEGSLEAEWTLDRDRPGALPKSAELTETLELVGDEYVATRTRRLRTELQ